MKKIPSLRTLNEYFSYNKKTGDLTRNKGTKKRHQKGEVVGHKTIYGYFAVGIKDDNYLVHRIIWKMIYGTDPDGEIDHIDGDGLNNRKDNLRVVNSLTNGRNMKQFSNNKSNHTGVCWHKDAGKWRAYINNKYKQINLGLYTNIKDAITARKEAETKYGFHENHGRRT